LRILAAAKNRRLVLRRGALTTGKNKILALKGEKMRCKDRRWPPLREEGFSSRVKSHLDKKPGGFLNLLGDARLQGLKRRDWDVALRYLESSTREGRRVRAKS